jgi:hypothetical protein
MCRHGARGQVGELLLRLALLLAASFTVIVSAGVLGASLPSFEMVINGFAQGLMIA